MYFPNGAIMQQFTPKTFGPGFEFTPTLKPLEPFKDNLVVVTNLSRSHPGSQVGDHAVSAAGFLTGVWPKRTEAEDVLANTTIDQVVAKQIGQDTPLPSLELATEDFTGYVGGCSPGFSCAYMNTISWSTPSTPLPMETNPRAVFERMFGERRHAGASTGAAAEGAKHSRFHRRRCQGPGADLGTRDRARLGEYLDNIREIERRIQKIRSSQRFGRRRSPRAPIGTPDSFEEHVGLMFDLAAAAYQADITRVFTFMMSRELSQRTYPQIGVTEQHHSVSHHLNNPEKMAQVVKINTYYVRMYAKFLEKLAATPDGDGSILDHSPARLWSRHGRFQRSRHRPSAHGPGRRWSGQGTPACRASCAHADREPLAECRGEVRRRGGDIRRQFGEDGCHQLGRCHLKHPALTGRGWSFLAGPVRYRQRRKSDGGRESRGPSNRSHSDPAARRCKCRRSGWKHRSSLCRPGRRPGDGSDPSQSRSGCESFQPQWRHPSLAGGNQRERRHRKELSESRGRRQQQPSRRRNRLDDCCGGR